MFDATVTTVGFALIHHLMRKESPCTRFSL